MMKRILWTMLIIIIAGAGATFFINQNSVVIDPPPESESEPTPTPISELTTPKPTREAQKEIPLAEVVVSDLEIPWDIAFLSDGRMLVSERPGQLSIIEKSGDRKVVHDEDVRHAGEGGLLGIALHPNFETNNFVYLYATKVNVSGGTINRIVRYRLENDKLVDETTILDEVPGARYHDGGRIEFGPNGLLYITTGDATVRQFAQDKGSLAGKILRIHDDGSIPENNPFGTEIYSYGHRNPQGLAWDEDGRLWSTEHGRSGALSGMDEVNLIEPGENYGWPIVEGDETKNGMISPVVHSGPDVTWAPASAAYMNGSLFFGGLKGETLYEAVLDGEHVVELKEHFVGEFGRIRTVRVGRDDMLYITTSNRDGRGDVHEGDDKIIRINPNLL